jgi:hypothetical protein
VAGGAITGALVSNRTAAWIAGLCFAAILLDLVLNRANASVFLILKLFDLLEFVMFWR